jgi:dTMP kinase
MAHQFPGTLITVEGIDGAGKSTVVAQLGSLLAAAGATTVTTKEPGGSKLGGVLRQMLQYQEIPIAPRAEYLLFAADRAQHFHEVVIPALQKGSVVISDRMSDSSLAYQGFGRGHDLTIIKIINQWTMQGIEPDLTIYLKIPVSLAYERMHERGVQKTVFESEKREFLERVARGFDQIFATRSNVITIDATQEQATVVNQTYERVQQWLSQRVK